MNSTKNLDSSNLDEMKAVRVIYAVSGIEEWTEVADRLRSRLRWEPIYWITQLTRNHDSVQDRFPAAVTHLAQELNRCCSAPGFEDCFNYPLDEALCDALLPYERVAYQLMDRMELMGSFTFLERRRVYYRLLMYWCNVFELLNPQVIVFNTPPHSIGEYVLYALARQKGLYTPIYVSTALCGLLYINESVENNAVVVEEMYAELLSQNNAPRISNANQAYLANLRASSDIAAPWYVPIVQGQAERQHARYESRLRKIIDVQGKPLRLPEEYSDWFLSALRPEVQEKRESMAWSPEFYEKPLRRVYKQPSVSMENSNVTKAMFLDYLFYVYEYKLNLKSQYESLCTEVSDGLPFVYLPLHYQPERTTCPDGGIFNDQYLMVFILANSLPEGWLLYIKEHPTQFSYAGGGEQARTSCFYKDLISNPRVRLLKSNTNSIKLIDQSRAVATVTGMAGWEALCRGKPVLLFGNAWYTPCKGAFRVKTFQQCKDVMAEIALGACLDPKAIETFIAAIEAVAEPGFINSSNAPAVEITFDQHVENLSKLLIRYSDRIEIISDETR